MTLPWMAERIQLRAIASLRPHAGNARVHDAAQLAQIMASMQAFGFTNPLLVDEDGVLIAGHGRLRGCAPLALTRMKGAPRQRRRHRAGKAPRRSRTTPRQNNPPRPRPRRPIWEV